MTTNGNASGQAGAVETTQQPNYTTKRFPAFGKQMAHLRRKGLMPARRVIVATDWNIGKAFPRIMVTEETPVTNLRFNYLAGLNVQIVHFDRDEFILPDLITEIVKIKPATLTTFNMSAVKAGKPAFRLIFSQSVMEAA